MTGFKQKIKNTPILGAALIKVYRFLYPSFSLDALIAKYLAPKRATIIQIGSNDGKAGDPLFLLITKNTQWKVIFVEPVPYVFDRLKENYGDESRFIFENVAINDGTAQTFFSVREDARDHFQDLPYWYDQLGSFERENITKHLHGILEQFIEESTLQGMTLDSLLKKHAIDSLDMLHIDTEGYDWKVLRQLPLKKLKPLIILYEYKHLVESEKQQSIDFLQNDYYIFDFWGDFLAIQKEVIRKYDFRKLQDKLVNKV